MFFSLVATSLYIPTSSSSFFISLPTLPIFWVLDHSNPNGCEVAAHCGFHLHFLND